MVKNADEGATVPSVAPYSWAVNVVKLNRCKAQVNREQPTLKGAALEEAVKEAYVSAGGLIAGSKSSQKGKPKGKVVNMADDDGSKDE